jgi:hypothetical protein
MKLTKAQDAVVQFLWKHKYVSVDQYGRLTAGLEQTSAGAALSALKLVAAGLVCGSGGLLQLTEAGKRHAEPAWPSSDLVGVTGVSP